MEADVESPKLDEVSNDCVCGENKNEKEKEVEGEVGESQGAFIHSFIHSFHIGQARPPAVLLFGSAITSCLCETVDIQSLQDGPHVSDLRTANLHEYSRQLQYAYLSIASDTDSNEQKPAVAVCEVLQKKQRVEQAIGVCEAKQGAQLSRKGGALASSQK